MLAHPRLTLVPLWNLAPFRDWATRGWDWIRLACCPCCLEVRERVWYTCEPVTLGLALETAWGLVAKPGSDVRGVVTVLEGRSGRLSATGTPDSVASGTGTAGGAAAGTDAPAEMGGLVSGNSATCSRWPRLAGSRGLSSATRSDGQSQITVAAMMAPNAKPLTQIPGDQRRRATS